MILNDKEVTIIAVDFDGTITKTGKWPEIGEINYPMLHALLNAKVQGAKLVLWTNRQDDNSFRPGCLTEAILFCEGYGLTFDGVNENLPEVCECFDEHTRKISADYYIDDKSPGSMEWFIREYGTNTKLVYYPFTLETPMEVELPYTRAHARVWLNTTNPNLNPILCIQLLRYDPPVGLSPYGEVGYLEVKVDGNNYKKYELRDCDIIIGVREEGREARIEFTINEKDYVDEQ